MTNLMSTSIYSIDVDAEQASDEFVLLAARGEFGDEVVDLLQLDEPEIEEHLAAAARKARMTPLEVIAYLRRRVGNGAYNDNQLRCVAHRLRELIDPSWERPELAAFRAELTVMAQRIVDEARGQELLSA